MTAADHRGACFAPAVAALAPEDRRRVDALHEQFAAAVQYREWLLRVARARREEAGEGHGDANAGCRLSPQDIDGLSAGFATIHDGERLDDDSSSANAVPARLQDVGR